MLQEIVISVIVSIDIFLTASVYRSSKIEIPFLSAVIISSVSAAAMVFSLVLSELISRFLSADICNILGFIILMTIGITTVLKSIVRTVVRRISENGELSLHGSGIIVKLYLDDTAADVDKSKILSPKEAATLAVLGSLDAISTGLSVGYNEVNPIITAVFTFIAGSSAIVLGNIAGEKISSCKNDLSWLGGAALILFAVFEFLY